MQLLVNGSSSAGNSYVLKASDGHMLLLECGVDARTIKRSIDYDMANVDCCVVSHSHGDHAKALPEVLKWGVPVMGPKEMFEGFDSPYAHPIEPQATEKFGPWIVVSFPVIHDVPCYGYIIGHKEMGGLLFITDTVTTEYRIKGLSQILIECNYDDQTLQESIQEKVTSGAEYNRLTTSHMELQTTLEILRGTDLSQVRNIVLIHTSSRNSDSERYREMMIDEFDIPVHIARKDLCINLDDNPSF